MRELYSTGWMHNRVRMIVGSLVKHLLINWTEGEKHFKNCLLDYNKQIMFQDGNGLRAVELMQHLTLEYLIRFSKARNLIEMVFTLRNGFQN